MDLTPPLTWSPASTPKTCCPSEASSSDYPSPPDLGDQHYKISFACKSDPACSIRPFDRHSPRLGAITHPDWSPASALHPALTAASLTNIQIAEYDVFATYDVSYPRNVYSGRGSTSPSPHSLPVSRPPVSAIKSSLQYPPISSPSHPGTARLKLEDVGSDYGMQSSDYLSPTLGNEPCPGGVSSHLSLPPLGSPPQSPAGYTTGDVLASWPQATEYPAEPDQLYSGSSIRQSLMLRRFTPRADGERTERAPRKFTTKEEANFQCDINGCGKFFSRSYNFKAHMKIHREKRDYPFPCQHEDCTKRFMRRTDLQRHHQSVHTKERNHECGYCGRMFARKDTLKRHKSDGCHRRFDLGTMDLRAEDHDQRELFLPPNLPLLAIPPTSMHDSTVPSLVKRESGESDPAWSR